MTGCGESRRAFIKSSAALPGAAPLMEGMLRAGPGGDTGPLLAYVGTFCYPPSFSFDPTGRFLYCCKRRGDNVAVFWVDRKSGGLSFTGHYVPVGNPSSIAFLDRKKGD